MTIGERLAALRPDERRNEFRLKEAVNQAATEIAHEYLAEIAPYVAELDLDRLFHRLPGHIMTRAEVEAITAGDDDGLDGGDALQRALSRRPARLRPARPRPRRVAAALPAPRRGDARDQRHVAARDPLPRPSGAVRRDRPDQSRSSCSGSTGSTSSATTGRGASRATARARARRAPVLRPEGRHPGLRQPDARRRRCAGANRARGSRAALGAGGSDHRDPLGRLGA